MAVRSSSTTPGILASGVDFSEYTLDLTAADLIAGSGSPSTDCLGEWVVVNPLNVPFTDRKGLPNFRQPWRRWRSAGRSTGPARVSRYCRRVPHMLATVRGRKLALGTAWLDDAA